MRQRTVAFIGTLLIGAVLGTSGFAAAFASPHVIKGAAIQSLTADFITIRPVKGPGGTEVWVQGYAAAGTCPGIGIYFFDSAQTLTFLGAVQGGDVSFIGNIPSGVALGAGLVKAIRGFRDPNNPRHCHASLAAQTPFTVTNGSGIFGFSPRSGPVGTVVTITGIRFTGATKVRFNGTPSAFTVDSDTQITATVPTGATTGQIKIVTPIGKAKSGPDFVVT